MADSIEEEVIPPLDEVPNMKVADLKKKLKAFGLSTAGNKNDLVARLIELCSTKETDSLDSCLSLEASQISGLDEAADSATLATADSQDNFSSLELSLEEQSSGLVNPDSKMNPNTNSSGLVAKPLKKRTIVPSNDEVQLQKKVVLNRSTTAHTEVAPNVSTSQKQLIKVQNNTSDEKVPAMVKNLSAAERMALRAKRFNVGNATVTSTSAVKVTSSRTSKQSVLTPVSTDVAVLKKRAERFGQNVSSVLKDLEQKEKLLKRKCKFGTSLAAAPSSNVDEKEKKKLRAARFRQA